MLFQGNPMIRWQPKTPAPPPQRWQSREEILKSYLGSLTPNELLYVQPSYYAWLYGSVSLQRGYASKANFDPNQPRVPAGNPDGGQWTSEGGTAAQSLDDGLEQALTTAPGQPSRSDLSELQAIANDPLIHRRIDEAWNQSNPHTTSPQEHGFWISRNETTGEVFTRPFTNPGSAVSVTPGPTPSDAVAFFHTHPNRPALGYLSGPSRADLGFAASVGLPGLIQSHNGMYYFGPTLSSRRPR